jgi:hypothetical protein
VLRKMLGVLQSGFEGAIFEGNGINNSSVSLEI